MPTQKNYYKILQVDPSAESEVIIAAYKRLSLKYHPDTSSSPEANRRMQEINEAYQVLKDPIRRADYDLYLREANWTGSGDHSSRQYHPGAGSPPRSYSKPEPRASSQQKLSEMVVALSFPLTYVLAVFVLFRVFRPYNVFLIAAVVILAGIIAYHVSNRVANFFRK